MERNTSQKQIILNYLKKSRNHPSAEDIYIDVKKILPTISKGTVYRILNNFKKRGVILAIESDKTYFDGFTHNHAHLICEKCKRVFDVEDIEQKINFPKKVESGEINSFELIFHGICNKCLKISNN